MSNINNTISRKESKTNKQKIELTSLFLSLMIVTIMVLILLEPVTYSKSIINGLTLYFFNVLPGLLPFMFFIKELTNQNFIIKLTRPFKKLSKKLFGVNEYGFYAFLMSIISGYPLGAKITSDLYLKNNITSITLTKTAILSSTPGLIFVIGSVGGLMLNNVKLGLFIYILNIISCLITSFLINLFSKNKGFEPTNTQINSQKQNLGLITQDTTISLLSVGFYIALFSLIIDLFINLNIFSSLSILFQLTPEKSALSQGIMSGIIEMTNGVKSLANNLSPISLSFISSIVSFSGISILMQSLSFLSQTGIKQTNFILGKFLQSIICFTISYLFFSLIL